MRKNFAMAIFLMALLVLPVFVVFADDSSGSGEISFDNEGTGIIEGQVTSTNGEGRYLNGAKVTLYIDGEQFGNPEYTSGSGSFKFEDVPTDGEEYKLKVEKKGFLSWEDSITVSSWVDPFKWPNPINLKPSDELDSAHIMVYIGAGCSLLLIALAAIHIIRKR